MDRNVKRLLILPLLTTHHYELSQVRKGDRDSLHLQSRYLLGLTLLLPIRQALNNRIEGSGARHERRTLMVGYLPTYIVKELPELNEICGCCDGRPFISPGAKDLIHIPSVLKHSNGGVIGTLFVRHTAEVGYEPVGILLRMCKERLQLLTPQSVSISKIKARKEAQEGEVITVKGWHMSRRKAR